ncbi:hypothetical protein DEA98_27735 [Brucella pseudogrignonensis]|nr:hypothetical protein [Brucella pseudogrignonensis]
MIATTCLAEVRQVPLQLSRYSHAKTSISAAALLMPATGLVLIFMALPLLYLLRYSFNDFVPGEFMVQGFTIANFATFLRTHII